MNRFEYIPARLNENEFFVSKESQIKLYDGDQKVGKLFIKKIKFVNFLYFFNNRHNLRKENWC